MYRTLALRTCLLASLALAACDPGSSVPRDPEQENTPTPTGCKSNEIWFQSKCVALPEVKVDTVGYLVGRAKRATVPAVDGISTFALLDADTDEVVFEGDLSEPTTNSDTGDTTRIADFTTFEKPGKYVVRIEGLEDSSAFRVGDDALNDALRVTMLGLYGLRCGVAVSFEHQGDTFAHAACHVKDAQRDGVQADGMGGWHDAGDYGKYTVNASFALAFLLKAWEDFGSGLATLEHIPNREGELPAWLDEAKFQLDQILKMQLPDGSAAHMIGPKAFPGMIMPEDDGVVRSFSGSSSTATADLAAVASMAVRVFRSIDPAYADKCLTAAELALGWLDQHAETSWPDLSGFTHNAYRTGGTDADDRFWAVAEYWRTTGDPTYLTRVESSLRTAVGINFDWGNVDNLGMFSYVQATSDARDATKLAAARKAVLDSATTLVNGAASHAYGRGIGPMYYWGSNGVLARSVVNLFVANAIEPDPRYLDAAVQQIDHLLGRNVFGRSFVTGLGYLPAMHPHHRPSEGDQVIAPWPGLLVGGANAGTNDGDPVKLARNSASMPPGRVWFDDSGSFGTNEVAINWNTALAYALAGFYK